MRKAKVRKSRTRPVIMPFLVVLALLAPRVVPLELLTPEFAANVIVYDKQIVRQATDQDKRDQQMSQQQHLIEPLKEYHAISPKDC